MIILVAITIAILIVGGQALWKSAVSGVPKGSLESFNALQLVEFAFSLKIILGIVLYAAATISYIYFLSKYDYFQLQSIVVGGSLVVTLMVAVALFDEKPTIINILGIALIILGATFVASK